MEEQRKVFEAQFESLESLGFGDKTKNIQNDKSGSDMDAEEEKNSWDSSNSGSEDGEQDSDMENNEENVEE